MRKKKSGKRDKKKGERNERRNYLVSKKVDQSKWKAKIPRVGHQRRNLLVPRHEGLFLQRVEVLKSKAIIVLQVNFVNHFFFHIWNGKGEGGAAYLSVGLFVYQSSAKTVTWAIF